MSPVRPADVGEVAPATAPLQALARAAVEINGAADADGLLRAVALHARSVVGARMSVISLSRDGDAQEIMATSLAPRYAAWRTYVRAPDGSGIYAEVLRSRRPLRLTQAELEAHPAFRGFGDESRRHPPLRGLLAAPLTTRGGHVMGLLQVSDRAEGDFDADDEAALLQIALVAGAAIERHRREAEAERVRRDLAEAQRIAHLGSWVRDLRRGRLTWSDEVHRIVGVPRESFAGTYEALLELAHPEDREVLGATIADVVSEPGRTLALEHRIVRPDGEVRVVLMRAEVEWDGTEAVRMLGTVLDVTRRRAAEDDLRAHTEQSARLAADRRRLIAESLAAEERVRQQIAEALHDGVLQEVLAVRQDLAECMARSEDPLLARALANLTGAAAGLRAAVGGLHPLTLAHGGLEAALTKVGGAIGHRSGLPIQVDVAPDVGGGNDRMIFAVAREFLLNAERHARASRVSLSLRREGPSVRLVVADDGVGFPEGQASRVGHIGLASSRERVEAAGGTMSVVTAPGRGTRIVAVIPSEPGAAGADAGAAGLAGRSG